MLKNLHSSLLRYSLLIAAVLFAGILAAQTKKKPPVEKDPFIVTFEDALTGRIYLSRRYTSLGLQADETNELRYRPNTLLSMGVNASYKSLSVSLGSGFGFLNPDKAEKGRTRSFDFQTHLYTRHWVTDLYAQFYKGYYLNQANFANTNGNKYYVRPDIKVNLLGASAYRLLNGEQFSYRAGFLQNEWQKKSAGSFLLGAEIYYGTMRGDSALVPGYLKPFYPQRDIHRVRLFEIGPGAGYAYTAVYQENFFATASLTLNVDYSMVKETSESGSENRGTVSPNALFRMVAGYNSAEWAATIGWVHNSTNAKGSSSNEHYRIKTGGFSITVAKRFIAGNKFKKRVEPILKRLP